MKKLIIKNAKDIPDTWIKSVVRKKTSVRIRPCKGVESFKVSWQDAELISDPEKDVIIIQDDDKEYPCKIDIFEESYVISSNDPNRFVKKSTNQIVKIPENYSVEIETLEGVLPEVSFPDYISIGIKGELYANTEKFVKEILEVINQ